MTAPVATRMNLLNRLPTGVWSLRSIAAPIRVDPRIMQHPRCGAGRQVAGPWLVGVPVAEAGGRRAANLATLSQLRACRSQSVRQRPAIYRPYLARATRPIKEQTTPGRLRRAVAREVRTHDHGDIAPPGSP